VLLAAEYAQLFASCYPGGVVWLSALGHNTCGWALPVHLARPSADAQLAQLAAQLGLEVAEAEPQVVRTAVTTALDERDEATLWVVDDPPTGLSAADFEAWRCPASCVAELITTRYRSHSRVDTLDLDVL
jgi:hypothetical protein